MKTEGLLSAEDDYIMNDRKFHNKRENKEPERAKESSGEIWCYISSLLFQCMPVCR